MKKLLALTMSCLILSGCATANFRTNQKFEGFFSSQKNVAIMPPDIKINKLSAGGVPELVDEWSDDAKGKILAILTKELSLFPSMKVSLIKDFEMQESAKYSLKEQQGLFRAVADSIIIHTYLPESTFKHKLANFDYTLGTEISTLSSAADSDVLLFCLGTNYLWTGGRIALSIFGMLASGVTGVYVGPMPMPEYFILSLVDSKTGDVIWFDYVYAPGDLRNEEVDQKLVSRILNNFPKSWK